MDQDAFRKLLSSSRQPQPGDGQRPQNGIPTKTKAKSISASEPAFKPRKLNKAEGRYRDRAAERREGVGNDYAEVEAILEDFEKRAAHEDKEIIEEQRKYLGGDSQHTVLVKGLDMSLLEQNRARAAVSTEDDDILEQAFVEATTGTVSESTGPRKRTREEIVRDLKAKRQGNNGGELTEERVVVEESQEEDKSLEVAKKAGKFKPIGFKPISQPEKTKKRKVKDGKEGGKKKKTKAEGTPAQLEVMNNPEPSPTIPNNSEASSSTLAQKPLKPPPEPELTPLNEDFDIFADAGDYEGIQVDDESDDEHPAAEPPKPVPETEAPVTGRGWFDEPPSEPVPRPAKTPTPAPPTKSPPPEEATGEERLRPLESSALPSIRDFLAMDEAAEKAEKRRARKEKKKKKKKGGDDDDD